MHNYSQHVILNLKRFAWILLFYFVSRLLFYILNGNYFNDISFSALIIVFVAGIRFDIAAIVFTNFFLLFLLLPGAYKNNRIIMFTAEILFFTINAIALLSNFIDIKFFDFINKRTTSSVFQMLDTDKDIWLLMPKFIVDYWYIPVAWIICSWLFWKYRPKLVFHNSSDSTHFKIKHIVLQSVVFILLTGLMLLGARGTGLKPISMVDAASYTELKYVSLVLNTPFSIIKSIENENLTTLRYYDDETLANIYSPMHQGDAKKTFKKQNVVIIILESFSKEYCGFLGGHKGYTPSLDSLLANSLVFPNAYANGTQSYEALPAIIAGIPSLMDRPYSGSNYADNMIESLPYLLSQEGYHTSFYHGGNNGTMGFKNFSRIAGIEYYMGRDEYNNDADYDGFWGIWDEPYLKYFAEQINVLPQPFFTTVFTLSSHHPYNVPEKYKSRFTEGKLPILKSIAYTDYALGEFFRTIKTMPWFDSTLFVLTADHAAQAYDQEYNSTTGMFSIPLALYKPSDSTFNRLDSTTCQQIDIMPTVLDYLGYNKSYFAFGENILDTVHNHRSICYVNGIYQLIQDSYVIQFDGKEIISFYNVSETGNKSSKKTDMNSEEKTIYDNMEASLKAILQTYNNCLISNKTALTKKIR